LLLTDMSVYSLGQARPERDQLVADATLSVMWPLAYRIALLVLKDHMSAEDVAQEACVKAMQSHKTLRDPVAFDSWFRMIATRLALTSYRRHQRTYRHEVSVDRLPDVEVTSTADDADLCRAVMSLPDEFRLPLVLTYVCGFTSSEIGVRLRIPPGTVRYRLVRARDLLRPQLEEFSE
jgi:RNA polymerase sigma-70 factor, ECF subfamily